MCWTPVVKRSHLVYMYMLEVVMIQLETAEKKEVFYYVINCVD